MTFASCYKDYVNFSIDYNAATYNADSTELAFFRFVQISQPAKGITAFPDGGRPKVLYKDISLLHYKIGDDQLYNIFNFGSLPYNKTRWENQASFENDYIAFSIRPLGGWDKEINKSPTIIELEKKLKGVFVFNTTNSKLVKYFDFGFHPVFSPNTVHLAFLKEQKDTIQIILADNQTNEKVLVSSSKINKHSLQWLNNSEIAFRTNAGGHRVNINTNKKTSGRKDSIEIVKSVSPQIIKQLLAKMPFKNQHIPLNIIEAKSKKNLTTELIELKGSYYYRKAIIEFLEKDLSTKEIRKILERIENHKNSLTNYDRVVYEAAMKETSEQLINLIERLKN